MIKNIHSPLVSIIVYVYNSKDFLIETLDSIKNQTYKNLELIIADDFSSDNTIELAHTWIDENKERFTAVKIVQTDQNTGIAGNNNRGFAASTGEWLKFMPGDDLLLPHAIEDLTAFHANNDIGFIYSNIVFFNKSLDTNLPAKGEELRGNLKIRLVDGNGIYAMSTLIRRSAFMAVKGFDERFPMLDDWPLWLKLAEHEVGFKYVNKVTAGYRKHSSNISSSKQKSIAFSRSCLLFLKSELIPKGIKFGLYKKTYNRIIKYSLSSIQVRTNNPYVIKATDKLVIFKIGYLSSYLKHKFQKTLKQKNKR